ncbi:class I glutamine amidotransferase-like protein [Phlyctochytrium arcticum]|nr:class I glutamine amidotransferase-like protein [Phlyctochytrium arcticum]
MAGKTAALILFILTSHDQLANTGKKTGWYLSEVAHPYHVLSPHFEIIWASPNGGEAPLDPSSIEAAKDDKIAQDFLKDATATKAWHNTIKISEVASRVNELSAVFYPGGHGPVFDLVNNKDAQDITAKVYEAGGVVGAVCHGSAALANIKLSSGDLLVKGKNVTGFTNAEEEIAGLTKALPVLLEDELKKAGGKFSNASQAWGEHVVVDGKLVTGQNPASASALAERIKELLSK